MLDVDDLDLAQPQLLNYSISIQYNLTAIIVFMHCAQELEDACEWLDSWERYIRTLPAPHQKQFLSDQTCHGLRISLHSTLELSKLLLAEGFSYVLTGKFNQDPLEVSLLISFNHPYCSVYSTQYTLKFAMQFSVVTYFANQ